MISEPVRLPSEPHYRIWGSKATEPWYGNPGSQVIGEVWFQASESVPLLVKLLFTVDNLSVQVHPADDYAREHEHSLGKTEMWHVLRAEPGAKIALGVKAPVTREELRTAAESGAIVGLLNWLEVRAGDTYFIPAGTIHAIGAGLTICEVQQVSDITYRLYDYDRIDIDGKKRELHLRDGVAVSRLEPGGAAAVPEQLGGGRELLAECEYFRTERLVVNGRAEAPARAHNQLCIAIEGAGTIGGQPFTAGEAWEVGAGQSAEIVSPAAVLILTAQP